MLHSFGEALGLRSHAPLSLADLMAFVSCRPAAAAPPPQVSLVAANRLSRDLHLDLANALPGEAVEALSEWMQNDAFLNK